ncbi:MAG TPA: glycosyltransferase [Cytophagaceae bacterium]|jgi:glycosyltransferase involved in cell wall biosynthesis
MEHLLIAFPNKSTFSETFISNQIKELNPQLALYEGWYPSILPNGRSFLPFPLNSIFFRGSCRNLFPQVYHRLYSKALSNYLIKKKIRMVLANYGPMGAALSDACRLAKVDLIIHFHGFDISDAATLKVYSKLYKKAFEHCKAVVSVSNDMTQQLIKLGASPRKIHQNPYGIEVEKFQGAYPGSKDPIFIAVGRFTAKKAPHLTIKAFSKVIAEIPNARLNMIGEGELLEECKQLAKELNIGDNINFLGIQSPDQVCDQLKAAKIFVQHSVTAPSGDSEGTPNTILEASAVGLPIVSTFHAGIKEAVIHQKTGYLVEEGDWVVMAEYMIRLAKDSALCAELGTAGRAHIIQNYNLKDRIKSLKAILES